MSPTTLPPVQSLYQDLQKGVQSLIQQSPGTPQLVGIASGGMWLAQRLQRDLQLPGESGVLSSALHRDDFAQRGLSAAAQTQLPFDVTGSHLIVIDDVIFTGRTIRAVLNEIFDYGRPASVTLAVLVDRSGRELPIQPQFAAARIDLPASQSLQLTLDEQGEFVLSSQVQA